MANRPSTTIEESHEMTISQKRAYDFLHLLGNHDPNSRELTIAENLLAKHPALIVKME